MVTEEEVREMREYAQSWVDRPVGVGTMTDRNALNVVRLSEPWLDIPEPLVERSAVWLASNKKRSDEVRWGVFPLGMVARWIERAEGAEGLVLAQRDVVAAATDPFLAIVEYHPDASEVGNAEMKRAADRLRAAVAAVVSGTPEAKE
jgi:hypothetical protein